MLIINVIVAYLVGYSMPDNLWVYFVFLQNFASEHLLFFPESWSLSVEEYAYIVLPLLFCLVYWLLNTSNKNKVFLWVTMITILILFLFKIDYFVNTNVTSYKYWSETFRKVVLYQLDAIYIGFLMVYLTHFKKAFMCKQNGCLAIYFRNVYAIVASCDSFLVATSTRC